MYIYSYDIINYKILTLIMEVTNEDKTTETKNPYFIIININI